MSCSQIAVPLRESEAPYGIAEAIDMSLVVSSGANLRLGELIRKTSIRHDSRWSLA